MRVEHSVSQLHRIGTALADSHAVFADLSVPSLHCFPTIEIEADMEYKNAALGKDKNATLGRTDWVEIALPIVLVITGVILVTGDYFGMLSLERIQNLWPLALILIGFVELVARG